MVATEMRVRKNVANAVVELLESCAPLAKIGTLITDLNPRDFTVAAWASSV